MTTMIQNPEKPVDPNETITFTMTQTACREALERVVADFNPSHSNDVGRVKLLAAALITECIVLRDRTKNVLSETVGDQPNVPNIAHNRAMQKGARWAAEAATNFETGAMYLVKSITAR